MNYPEECPYCGTDKDSIYGWIVNDFLRTWECKKCGKKWPREFDKKYYDMLKTVHVIIDGKQHSFFEQEIYSLDEFDECGLNVEILIEKGIVSNE